VVSRCGLRPMRPAFALGASEYCFVELIRVAGVLQRDDTSILVDGGQHSW
jgi:hypothetical protein